MNMYLEAVMDVDDGRWVWARLVDEDFGGTYPTLMLDGFGIGQDDYEDVVDLYARKFGLNIENAGEPVHFTESDSSYRIDVQVKGE